MPPTQGPFRMRIATSADIDAIVRTLTTAFFNDPLWAPAFPDTERRAEQSAAMWRLYATSALRHHWTFVSDHAEATAVWIPPGRSELTSEEAAGLPDLLRQVAGQDVAETIMKMNDQFAAARPQRPHFYLTLLAVHDQHRGQGLGMSLLAESLAHIDALELPAYLESSNPANIQRYESVGFVPQEEVVVATGQVVTTMWRPAAGSSPGDGPVDRPA
ncbi:N-acetyltransferase [Streptomyces fumanus]|uniref:N-acetyltransferase n=2 Tax=Streptomyces fumanus TaxID=67302 RepID=A0A919AAR3_9ACTN|nr:N-acetyltransferase [Streptomyces fumanus]